MRRILFLLYLMCCWNFAFPQVIQVDSLKLILQDSQTNDSTKVDVLLELVDFYKSTSIDSMAFYAQKTLEQSLQSHNYKLATAYNNIGLIKYYKDEVDSARIFYEKTLKLLDKEEDSILRAKTYSNIAMTFKESYDVKRRIDYKLKAVDLVKNNQAEVSLIYANLATEYEYLQLYEKCREYYKKAYSASKEGKNYRVQAYSIYGLTNMLIDEDKYDSIAMYLKEGMSLCSKTNSPEICYWMNNQMGNNFTNLEEYSKANKHLKLAREYAVQLNKEFDVVVSTVSLARNEFEMGNYASASKYYQELEAYYEDEPVPALLVHGYLNYAETEAALGNFEKSYYILDEYVEVKDSLLTDERRALALEMEEKYETEKKNKELAEQSAQLQEQENTLLKRNNQIKLSLLGGGFLLLGGIGIWLYSRQRQKLKDNRILALKNEQEVVKLEALITGEEKERVRLAQDLHDGINGDLSVIKYKISNVDKSAFSNEEKQEYKEAITMLDNAVEQVRRISHNLAPPSLHNFDLIEAIKQYCTKVNTSSKVSVDFQYYGDQFQLNKEHETAVYRMIQEMLNNIVKHAEASEALVQLNHRDDHLHLTVEDNGKGFNIDEKAEGMGLKNIRSRADFLKADLDISSGKNGTTFGLVVELDKLATND
ncbi:sensor histidine kinase [Spongiivirga sp. MCCC 1A20706]|uniref:tetratricopeptide repeat-containing sensor histidine kinase n=1 Tax=Spongiivirga sp. MCCC 1A20706 TaxID=3160963 RepID=UPI003977B4E9